MKLLKKGITGFFKKENIKKHTEIQIKDFIKNIKFPYILIGEIESPNHSSNYYRFTILKQNKNEKFDLLINSCFWIIAGIKSESSWMNLDFIDIDSNLSEQLTNQNAELQILNKELLDSIIPEEEINILDKSEIDQIIYWKSETYGEIIFNGYD